MMMSARSVARCWTARRMRAISPSSRAKASAAGSVSSSTFSLRAVSSVISFLLQAHSKGPAPFHRHGRRKIAGQVATKFCIDAKFTRLTAQQGFQLRVALQALRHVGHVCGNPTRTSSVAIALHRLPSLTQPLPVADKAVGALRRIDADFGLKLHGADRALAAAIDGLADKFKLALQGAGKIVGGMGPDRIERLPGLLQH